jgi:hypothetical protein
MFPGYFSVVMATGIISIGTFLLGMKWLAWALLAITLSLTQSFVFCW